MEWDCALPSCAFSKRQSQNTCQFLTVLSSSYQQHCCPVQTEKDLLGLSHRCLQHRIIGTLCATVNQLQTCLIPSVLILRLRTSTSLGHQWTSLIRRMLLRNNAVGGQCINGSWHQVLNYILQLITAFVPQPNNFFQQGIRLWVLFCFSYLLYPEFRDPKRFNPLYWCVRTVLEEGGWVLQWAQLGIWPGFFGGVFLQHRVNWVYMPLSKTLAVHGGS